MGIKFEVVSFTLLRQIYYFYFIGNNDAGMNLIYTENFDEFCENMFNIFDVLGK